MHLPFKVFENEMQRFKKVEIRKTLTGNVDLVRGIIAVDWRLICERIRWNDSIIPYIRITSSDQQTKQGKLFAKWVPHLLTKEQKAMRVQTSETHLQSLQFLNRIVTGNETWINAWDSELIRQSG